MGRWAQPPALLLGKCTLLQIVRLPLIAGGVGGALQAPALSLGEYTLPCAFSFLGTFCNLYYISLIRKNLKTHKEDRGHICLLLVVSKASHSRVYAALYVLLCIASPSHYMHSLAMARFDLRCACDTATTPPCVKENWSTHQQNRIPHPNCFFFLRGPAL